MHRVGSTCPCCGVPRPIFRFPQNTLPSSLACTVSGAPWQNYYLTTARVSVPRRRGTGCPTIHRQTSNPPWNKRRTCRFRGRHCRCPSSPARRTCAPIVLPSGGMQSELLHRPSQRGRVLLQREVMVPRSGPRSQCHMWRRGRALGARRGVPGEPLFCRAARGLGCLWGEG